MVGARHPKKDIRRALEDAEDAGLVVATATGHRWGYIRCPECKETDLSVWSTPRVPEHHAAAIYRFITRHQHKEGRP